jgi:hypothetical protein
MTKLAPRVASVQRPRVSECNQLGKLLLLPGNPGCCPGFISGTGVSGSLFDQLVS